MRASSFFVSACAIFLIAPSAWADPGGVDAPDWPAGVGAPTPFPVEGEIVGADFGDFYRLVAPPGGDGVLVRLVTGQAGFVLSVISDRATQHASAVLQPGSVAFVAEIVAPRSANGTLVVGTFRWGPETPPPGTYRLEAEATGLPDLAFTSLRVENVQDLSVPVRTDIASGTGTKRVVHATFANLGDAPGRGDLFVWAGTTKTLVSVRDTVLAPGESRTYTAPWDGTGMVGEICISGRAAPVTPEIDRDLENNARHVNHYVIASTGTGIGAQPLPHLRSC